MRDQRSKPKNLPDHWDYQEATNCVVCGGCAFRYGAEHPDGDGKWTCPNCGDGALSDSVVERVARAIEATYEQFADPTPAQRARAALEETPPASEVSVGLDAAITDELADRPRDILREAKW